LNEVTPELVAKLTGAKDVIKVKTSKYSKMFAQHENDQSRPSLDEL
jgi:hypothetical protein